MPERLQKVLAAAGVASRRDAESLITSGKVSVNGEVVTEPGHKIDPERDTVAVEGRNIPRDVPLVYVALYKPKGFVTTREDPHATHTVMELIREPLEARMGRGHPAVEGLHPVGRLDTQSEGLLILTNDGAFTHALTHPSHQVPKLYRAQVRGIPDREAIEKVRTGIPLFGKRTLPARARVVRADRMREVSTVEVELREGRNQQVRRMLQAVGHPVDTLMRVAIGPVKLDRMKPGQWRFLTDHEVAALLHMAEHPEPVVHDEADDANLDRGPRRPAGGARGQGPRGPRPAGRPAGRFGDGPPPRGGQRPGFGSAPRGGERGPRFGDDRGAPRGPRPGGDDRRPPRYGDERPAPRGDRPGGDDRRPPRYGDERPAPRGDRDARPPRFGDDRGRGGRPTGERGPAPRGGEGRPPYSGEGGGRSFGPRPPRFGDSGGRPGGPPRSGDGPPRGGDRGPRYGDGGGRPSGPRYGEGGDRPSGPRPPRGGEGGGRSYGPPSGERGGRPSGPRPPHAGEGGRPSGPRGGMGPGGRGPDGPPHPEGNGRPSSGERPRGPRPPSGPRGQGGRPGPGRPRPPRGS